MDSASGAAELVRCSNHSIRAPLTRLDRRLTKLEALAGNDTRSFDFPGNDRRNVHYPPIRQGKHHASTVAAFDRYALRRLKGHLRRHIHFETYYVQAVFPSMIR